MQLRIDKPETLATFVTRQHIERRRAKHKTITQKTTKMGILGSNPKNRGVKHGTGEG